MPLLLQIPKDRCGVPANGRPTALGEEWMLGSLLGPLTGCIAKMALLVPEGNQIPAKW